MTELEPTRTWAILRPNTFKFGWMIVLGCGAAGLLLILGSVIGELAFGRGTAGAVFTVLGTAVPTVVAASFWLRRCLGEYR